MISVPMKINYKKTTLYCNKNDRLSTVLRKYNYLYSIKESCLEGICGGCTILMNGKTTLSCIVPAISAKDADIMTLDYFKTTEDYADIKDGFEKLGITLCGVCDAEKILLAYEIILNNTRITKEDVLKYVKSCYCHCVDEDTLVNSIMMAFYFRRKRINGK